MREERGVVGSMMFGWGYGERASGARLCRALGEVEYMCDGMGCDGV